MSDRRLMHDPHPHLIVEDGKWVCMLCDVEIKYDPHHADTMWDWFHEHKRCGDG